MLFAKVTPERLQCNQFKNNTVGRKAKCSIKNVRELVVMDSISV